MKRTGQIEYLMIVEPTEDGEGEYYCAYFPDLPGCTTMAPTLRELDANAREAVELYLGALKQSGQPIPEPIHEFRKVSVNSEFVRNSAKHAQHVVPHKHGWAVKAEGSKRIQSVYSTQIEAVKAGRTIARGYSTELLIHSRSGRVRETTSYGNDPFPPRDSHSHKKTGRH